MLKSIIASGVSDEQPEDMRRIVRLSNIVILLLTFLGALPFTIVSSIYFPKLMYLPGSAAIVFVAAFFMNRQGAIHASRILTVLVALFTVAIYHYALCSEQDEPVPSLLLLQMSFSMIVFVLFDLNEKRFLIPLLALSFILIVGFPEFKTWISVDYDQAVLREGWISVASSAFGVLSGLTCIFSLSYSNKQATDQSAEILRTMEEKNKSLELSESQMKDNLGVIEKSKEEERKRNWAAEGLASIAETLRNSEDEHVFDQLIAGIVKYMNVNQGGLFVVEENDGAYDEKEKVKLTLKACYAYNRKKYIEQTFLPGQGLVGQVYLEKSSAYMKEIPDNYIRITSGLGEANPRALIVMPLMLNDQVEGVMELASFNELETYEIQFLEKACESIASFIHNDRINRQTRSLLEESITASEQLRAQEEEMRQNHEELMATQEEMRRQHEELNKLKENLEEEVRQQTTMLQEKNRQIELESKEREKENKQIRETYEGEISTMLRLWMSHLDVAGNLLEEKK